ncbi:MAG: hypothetical protein GXO91_04185 [FCB group bacterium]|nr:hypothetical protein [FCB group bacterium]
MSVVSSDRPTHNENTACEMILQGASPAVDKEIPDPLCPFNGLQAQQHSNADNLTATLSLHSKIQPKRGYPVEFHPV